jgi:hypothetical protein
MIGLDATQIATVIGTILIIYFQGRQIRADCKTWLWQLPLLIWMAHTLIFYSVLALDTLEVIDVHIYGNVVFSIWSAILRLHGTFTILGLEYTRYRAVKEIKRYGS